MVIIKLVGKENIGKKQVKVQFTKFTKYANTKTVKHSFGANLNGGKYFLYNVSYHQHQYMSKSRPVLNIKPILGPL